MVIAAVLVRSAIDDDSPAGPTAGGVVICAEDLMDHCRQLDPAIEVRSEPAAATAQAISEGRVAAEVDAWITSSAWVEVMAVRAPEALGRTRGLGTSPVVVATAPGRAAALGELCEGRDVWACLGESVGRPWGDLGAGNPAWRELEAGLPDPDQAVGLSVLASAAVGWFGGTDFAANDLDPSFSDFLAHLADASAGDEDPARTMAVAPGRYSAAGTVAQVAAALAGRDVAAIEPAREVRAVVVGAALRGRQLPDLDRLTSSLTRVGWLAATDATAEAPTLKPGVMAALHSLWKDVRP